MAEPVRSKRAAAESPQPLAVLATRGDGSFRLAIERPDFYLLRIAAPGFAPVEARLAPLLGDLTLPPIELVSKASKPAPAAPRPVPEAVRASGFLVGRLVSAFDGSPIGHGLIWSAEQPAFFARSDEQGRFRLALPERGSKAIEATASGFARQQLRISAQRGPRLQIALALAGRPAFGAIRDRTADPVDAARVILVPRDAEGAQPLSALSDPAGAFHFDLVPPGAFDLFVKAAGFAPLTLPTLLVPAGAEPWDLGTAFLAAGEAIEGRVVDDGGSAIAGARVRVLSEEAEEGRPSAATEAQVTTDEAGRFTLADQPAGTPCRLEVSASGFTPALTSGVAPTAEPITVVLRSAGRLSGTVLTGGSPVKGAVVVAEIAEGSPLAGRRFYTESDAHGRFLLADVEPGNLSLTAAAAGYADSGPLSLTLAAGELRAGLELHLAAGGSVSGNVSSGRGAPLADVVIEAFSEGGQQGGAAPSRRTAVSDRAGRFRLGGLQPGPWIFSASRPEFARKVARREVGAGEQPLNLTLESGAELAGTIANEAGEPVPGARVALSPTEGGAPELRLLPPLPGREVTSQADGSFRFSGIEDGSYRLRASKPGFAPAEPPEPIAFTGAPVADRVLRLARGRSVGGRLLGLPYSRLAGLEVFAFQDDGRSAQGEIEPTGGYRIRDLAPGRWHVVAEVEETGERAVGQILVGEEPALLDLDFAASKSIERPRDDRGGKRQPPAVEGNQPTRPLGGPRFQRRNP
jgi:hypothetical protein